jgi:hypothetical protein
MPGHFGFSYVGLIYLLMLWVPNILWSKNKPTDYTPSQENKVLAVFERVGQVACTASLLLFRDTNLAPFTAWTLWQIASFALMLLYEVYWIRYFTGEHTQASFYRSLLGIPVPGATLPVAAFLLLGVYGKVIWLIVASVILGVGHIGIHLQHRAAVVRKARTAE